MPSRCLRDPTFSHFDTILACDTHTDTMMANNRAVHLWTFRYRNDVATTLPLEVLTQRKFVADFFDRSWILLAKAAKLRFVPPFGDFGVTYTVSWLRGSVVERRSSAGILSLSCARPVADG